MSQPQRHERRQDADSDEPLLLPFSIPRKPLPQRPVHICEPEKKISERTSPSMFSRPSASPRSRRPIFYFWWLEALCCLIAITMLLAMIAILYPRRGLPLPQWPYSISINTLIAVLVVIMKAAILLVTAEGLSHLKFTWFTKERALLDLETYDMASRGPWSSVHLLMMLRYRHIVASIGAAVTLLALAVDPSTQQILRYYSCSIVDEHKNATMPRTILYETFGQHISSIYQTLRVDMQSAINAGVYSAGLTGVPVGCSTGNCSFTNVYQTVGMCNTCYNTTNQLAISQYNATSNYTTTYANSSVVDTYASSYSNNIATSSTTNLSLPSGLYSFLDGAKQGNLNVPYNFAYFIMQPGGVQALENNATLEMIFARSHLDYNNSMPPWAASCDFYPCVKSYTSEIHNGLLTETLVGDTIQVSTVQAESTIDVDCLSADQRQTLVNQGYELDPDTHWINWNITPPLNPFCERGGDCNETSYTSTSPNQIPINCTYSFYFYTWSPFQVFLRQFFNGSLNPSGSAFDGPSVMQTLYNDGHITMNSVFSILDRVAESMTNNIRLNGNTNLSEPALGIVRRQDTCVHVRWGWLAFPATLVVMTILFLVFLIIDSRSEEPRNHDWKSSLLPLLFHGLEHDVVVQYQKGEPTAGNELTEIVSGLRMQLRDTGDGWKFGRLTERTPNAMLNHQTPAIYCLIG